MLIISSGLETPFLFFCLLLPAWLSLCVSVDFFLFFQQIFVISAFISIMSNAQNLQLPPEYDVLNEPRLMPVHKTIAGHKGYYVGSVVRSAYMMGILIHYLSVFPEALAPCLNLAAYCIFLSTVHLLEVCFQVL